MTTNHLANLRQRINSRLRDSNIIRRIQSAGIRDFLDARLATFLATGNKLKFPTANGKPLLSVILFVDDRVDLTFGSLRSLADSLPTTVEVLCVATRFSAKTNKLFTRCDGLKTTAFPDAIGRTDVFNRAVNTALGEYVLFLRSGVEPAPNLVRETLLMLGSITSDVGAIGGMVVDRQGKILEAGAAIDQSDGITACGFRAQPLSPGVQFRRPIGCVVGAPLVSRRELFLAIGGFNNNLHLLPLADYCLRLWDMGLSVIYDPTLGGLSVADSAEESVEDLRSDSAQQEVKAVIELHKASLDCASSGKNTKSMPRVCYPTDHRKRILFIEDRIPHPRLGRGYPRTNMVLSGLAEIGCFVTLYPILKPNEDWASAYDDLPRDVEILLGYGNSRLAQLLRKRHRDFDLIWVCRPHNMATYKHAVAVNALVDLDSQRVIYDAEALFALREIGQLKLQGQTVSDEEKHRRIDQEIKLAEGCWSVLAVSESEGTHFAQRGITRVHALGHATTLCPTANAFAGRRTFLFVGALPDDECPNGEGLIWFCSYVLPILQRRLKTECKLIVAGANRLERRGPLDDSSIVFAGSVDDLYPLYDSARVFVAPIRFGAGIPLKIIEAAAHGVPVVAMPILATQLAWNHEHELLVAQSPEEFAESCLRLYEDERLWEDIRVRALDRVRTDYSIEGFSMKLQTIVEEAVGPIRAAHVQRPA